MRLAVKLDWKGLICIHTFQGLMIWGGQNKNGNNKGTYKTKKKRPYWTPTLTLYHNYHHHHHHHHQHHHPWIQKGSQTDCWILCYLPFLSSVYKHNEKFKKALLTSSKDHKGKLQELYLVQ
jgi:hypothetical protein